MSNQLKRASTVDEIETVMGNYFSKEAREYGGAFKPKLTDIMVTPAAKCGTTWLQHIAHGLRTRGNMDFDEINSVTPWGDTALDLGWDMDAPHVAEPRVFKYHRSWEDIPKGGRYIVSFRHHATAFVSFYRMFEGWYFEPGMVTLEQLLRWRFPEEEESVHFRHLRSWWSQRNNPDVLLLCYEDMKADLPRTVRLVADLMEIPLDDKLLDIVLRQSSRDFMLAHADKFDEKHMRDVGGERAGLPPPISSMKVTSGAGEDKTYQLSAEQKQYLEERWHDAITKPLGFSDYEAFRQAVHSLYV